MNLQKKNSNPSVVISMNTHFTCSIGMLILFSSAWFILYLFVIYKVNIEVYGILFLIVDLSYAKANHNEIYTQKLRTMKVWPIFILNFWPYFHSGIIPFNFPKKCPFLWFPVFSITSVPIKDILWMQYFIFK